MSQMGLIERSTVEGLAEQARRLSGASDKLTPKEALALLETISPPASTFILVTEDGEEIPAVLVEEKTVFDATANDIRLGKTAVTDSGVTTGEKEIPAYHTTEGIQVIPAGSEFNIVGLPRYDYTKLQALICAFNSSLSNSVATEKVSINSKVYGANGTEELSAVTTDPESMSIKFGIKNDGDKPRIIRYFTYKEEK